MVLKIRKIKDNETNIKPAEKCKYNPSTEYFKNDDDIYCFGLIHSSLITALIGLYTVFLNSLITLVI